jgi:hypothetical protein
MVFKAVITHSDWCVANQCATVRPGMGIQNGFFSGVPLALDPALAMMMSLYATLGIFLLIASRNPSGHRSLIAFTAWSGFAHAAVMPSKHYST